jgi:hypothetical protein
MGRDRAGNLVEVHVEGVRGDIVARELGEVHP